MLHPNDNAGEVLHRFDKTIERHEKLIKALTLGVTGLWVLNKISSCQLKEFRNEIKLIKSSLAASAATETAT